MKAEPERGEGLRKLPFLAIAERHFMPGFETLAGEVVPKSREVIAKTGVKPLKRAAR